MEGAWRGLSAGIAVLSATCALLVSGCGDDDASNAASESSPAAVETANPEQTFAPLVEMAYGAPSRPMSARWFIERSLLGIAEDRGCEDRRIAVGHLLPEQQDSVTDWIYIKSLGRGPHYYRNPLGPDCELAHGAQFYTDQLTRPHDPGSARPKAARPAVGFFLDLEDSAREGPGTLGQTPVYYERRDEGDSRVRLTYWMLYGVHTPSDLDSSPAHEGDWERVDVLLREAGENRYQPEAVQLGLDNGDIDPDALRERAWDTLAFYDKTHPRLLSDSQSHYLSPSSLDGDCSACIQWHTWEVLRDAPKQPWYGFGGAWGEVGPSDATTGPLGPHGLWPTDYAEADS